MPKSPSKLRFVERELDTIVKHLSPYEARKVKEDIMQAREILRKVDEALLDIAANRAKRNATKKGGKK